MSNAAIATARFSPATVTRQPDRTAHKFVLTGRSGIGKTFLASTIPGVFIIPVEEGLKGASPDHEPAHFAVVPRSLRELHQALDSFVDLNGPGPDRRRPYTHLAIDSLSGVEALVHDAALEAEHARHMDGKDYKVVWSAASSLWTEVQRKLDAIRRLGVHVWLIAHATETVDATVSGDTFRKWDLAFKGMLAVSREEAPEEPDAAAGEEKVPDTARAPADEPAINEVAVNEAEAAAPADLCAEPAAEPTVDETAAAADPTPTVDPAVVALAAELERQIADKTGAELEAMPDVVKAAKLPAPLEARIRTTYVARVRSLRSATAAAVEQRP